MNLNVIKLNPSQELALVRVRDKALGLDGLKLWKAKDRNADAAASKVLQDQEAADKNCRQDQEAAAPLIVRQEIAPGKPVPLSPLLCVLPDDFTKEEFLAIEKFEIYGAECLQDQKGRDLECRQDLNEDADKKALQDLNAGAADSKALQDLNASAADSKALKAQELGALYYFPAIIQSGGKKIRAAIPCAFGFALAQNFDLQKIFAAAQKCAQDQEGDDKKNQGQDLVLTPTSFYFARAEISKNAWSLYDAAWKKLATI